MSIRLQQNWSNSLLLIFAVSIWKKERKTQVLRKPVRRHKQRRLLCPGTQIKTPGLRQIHNANHSSVQVPDSDQLQRKESIKPPLFTLASRVLSGWKTLSSSPVAQFSCRKVTSQLFCQWRSCCCNCRAPLEVLRRRKEESWRAYHQRQYLPLCCRGKEHHAWYPSPRTR